MTARADLDGLTNLLNSSSFLRDAHRELQVSARVGRPFTIIYIDLDDFKTVNDTLGHNAGSDVLKQVGKFIAGHFRKDDLRARIGGDEFAIFLPDFSFEKAKTEVPQFHEKLNRVLGNAKYPSLAVWARSLSRKPLRQSKKPCMKRIC